MNFRFGILAIVIFPVFSAEGQQQKDREERELSGPVHIVKIKTESIFSVPGEKPIDGGWVPSITTFDRAGNVVEGVDYNEKGEVDQRSVGEVDRSGNKIKEKHFDAEGRLLYTFTWSYDDDGNQIEIKDVSADGTVTSWTKVYYDQSGKEISHSCLGKDGVVSSITEVSYDQNGKVIGESWYYIDNLEQQGRSVTSYKNGGKTEEIQTFGPSGDPEYRYISSDDEKNKHTEESYDGTGKLISKQAYELTRNDKGNWITETCSEWELKDNELVLLRKVKTTRTITYF